jgi:hypothetical protein
VKLTKEQSKMVLEYFSAQAAQDAPLLSTSYWVEWDKHMWMTNYQTSLAIERRINEHDWATLVNAALDYQSFDRDPDAYLYERGYEVNADQKWYMKGLLQDVLSSCIDNAFNTSKAA